VNQQVGFWLFLVREGSYMALFTLHPPSLPTIETLSHIEV